MSLLRTSSGSFSSISQSCAAFGGLSQIRTATKRVSGSKTNKNDSAGRRLGPKAYENTFVNTGEIIMRQRGTKIHPGENVAIGRDHTIFAMEPGYVKFYLDPFHPLRKFVGVALRKDQTLPKNHFDPRLRRFGYEQILDEAEAKKEEDHMSRKEYLAQDELKRAEEKRQASAQKYRSWMEQQIQKTFPELKDSDKATERLFKIGSLMKTGQSLEEARDQVTFIEIFELQLAQRRGELLEQEVKKKADEYKKFASELDAAVVLDHMTQVHKRLTAEAIQQKKTDILAKLDAEFTNIILKAEHKQAINELLNTPGVFTHEEIIEFRHKYIPKVLPETVLGTVLDIPKGKKLPKNAVEVKTFDPVKKIFRRVVRTTDAFP